MRSWKSNPLRRKRSLKPDTALAGIFLTFIMADELHQSACIDIAYEPEFEDARAAFRAHAKHFPLSWMFGSMPMIILWVLIFVPQFWKWRGLALIWACGMTLAAFLGSLWFSRMYWKRAWREDNPGGTVWFKFSDECAEFGSRGGQSVFGWNVFTHYREAKTVFLLYYGRRSYSYVPKRVFQDEQQLARFREMLARLIRYTSYRRSAEAFPVMQSDSSSPAN